MITIVIVAVEFEWAPAYHNIVIAPIYIYNPGYKGTQLHRPRPHPHPLSFPPTHTHTHTTTLQQTHTSISSSNNQFITGTHTYKYSYQLAADDIFKQTALMHLIFQVCSQISYWLNIGSNKGKWSGVHFTNDFSIVIQIRWKNGFSVNQF